MLNLRIILVATLFSSLCFVACQKDDGGSSPQGNENFSQDINEFVSQDIIDTLREHGMIIHEGKKPPDLEGVYYAAPFVLKSSAVPSDTSADVEGERFGDMKLRLREQNNEDLTIKGDYKQIDPTDESVIGEAIGNGGFIAGEGNQFTVFLKLEGTSSGTFSDDSASHVTSQIISGTITGDSIENYHHAIWMIEKDDPNDILIPENTGRVLQDEDGMAKGMDPSDFKRAPFSERESTGSNKFIMLKKHLVK